MTVPALTLTPRRHAMPAAGPGEIHLDHIQVQIAQSPQQISDAWRLVFEAYRQAQLIDDNPWGMHAVPHALRPSTRVVIASRGEQVLSTLTIMHDGPQGLALDAAYRGELDGLRQGGHRLMEVGLFADRQLPLPLATQAIMEMMRYVFYVSCYWLADIVVGVHPRHALFYQRHFGFEPFAAASTHPTVRHRPVIGLLGETQKQLQSKHVPRPLIEYVNRPLPRAELGFGPPAEPHAAFGHAFSEFVQGAWKKTGFAGPTLAGRA